MSPDRILDVPETCAERSIDSRGFFRASGESDGNLIPEPTLGVSVDGFRLMVALGVYASIILLRMA
jgi:hypothetical protein